MSGVTSRDGRGNALRRPRGEEEDKWPESQNRAERVAAPIVRSFREFENRLSETSGGVGWRAAARCIR